MLQPLRSTTVDDLLSEPHQADEGAQRAGNHKTALETVGKQVLSARERSQLVQELWDAAGPTRTGRRTGCGWAGCSQWLHLR